MTFHEGQTIVHPYHGPVQVTRIANRTVGGATVSYLDLCALNHPLRIAVPAHRIDEVGLREIASPERIEALLKILRDPATDAIMQWSRRIKDFQERFNTGEAEQLCFVIREITRGGVKSPASSEGSLLRAACQKLAIEFSLALTISRDEAIDVIKAAAQGEPAQATT